MNKTTDFHLLEHLPHLLRRGHFEADAAFVQVYGDAVTSRQLALLVTVARLPGASQSEVAAEIGLDLNTCSDLVARSIAKGLVTRKRSPDDGRRFCLGLTAAGRRHVAQGIDLAAQYQALVARRLSGRELAQLVRLLQKMLGFAQAPDHRQNP